ncbi:HDOD domain-containing protein, partial [Pseudomonas peli]|uniref:HDOD domain-containing protein n=1 Tax=Pseudomonas peli TaxID=592361 RepID=UPI003D31B509
QWYYCAWAFVFFFFNVPAPPESSTRGASSAASDVYKRQAYASAIGERRVVDTENRLLNTNHAVVGYFTAKSWNLPLHLCEACLLYTSP